jgi:hypothetical protein
MLTLIKQSSNENSIAPLVHPSVIEKPAQSVSQSIKIKKNSKERNEEQDDIEIGTMTALKVREETI